MKSVCPPPRVRLIVNSAANFSGVLLGAAAAIVATPMLLRELGPAGFGLFSIQIGVLIIFGINDLGISRAVVLQGLQIRSQDRRRLSIVVEKGLSLTAALTGIVLITSLFALTATKLFGFISTDSYLSWLFLFISAAVAVLSLPLRAVLEVQERFIDLNIWRSFATMTLFLGPALVSLVWPTPVAMMATVLASRVVILFIQAVVVLSITKMIRINRLLQGTRNILRGRRLEKFYTLAHLAGWLGVAGAASGIITYLDRFVIGIVSGPAEVAGYIVAAEVATKFWLITGAVVSATTPQLARAWSTGGTRAIGRLISFLAATLGLIVFTAQAAIALFGERALALWLGQSLEPDMYTVLNILMIGIAVNSVAGVNFLVMIVGGMSRTAAIIQLASLLFSIPAYFVGAALGGAQGVAWAFTIRLVVDAFVIRRLMPQLPVGDRVGLPSSLICVSVLAAVAVHFLH